MWCLTCDTVMGIQHVAHTTDCFVNPKHSTVPGSVWPSFTESHSVNSCFCFFPPPPAHVMQAPVWWSGIGTSVLCVQVNTCEKNPLPLLWLASPPTEKKGESLENKMCTLRVLLQGQITCDSRCKNHCTVPTLPLPTKLNKHKALLSDSNTGRRHKDLTQKWNKKKDILLKYKNNNI